jgi:hypothetical protein
MGGFFSVEPPHVNKPFTQNANRQKKYPIKQAPQPVQQPVQQSVQNTQNDEEENNTPMNENDENDENDEEERKKDEKHQENLKKSAQMRQEIEEETKRLIASRKLRQTGGKRRSYKSKHRSKKRRGTKRQVR